MSKSGISKIPAVAVLIGLSLLAASVGTIFAEDLPRATTAKPVTGTELPPTAANKPVLIPQRLTSGDIEYKLTIMRDKLASKEAAVRVKLQSFKDQKKATAAARINTSLNRINQNQVTQMQKYLDIMSSILDKLEARVNQPTPDIKNPADAKVAIASARAMIATASSAVSAQAQKDYTIQVTAESRIRADALSMRDKLYADIMALRKIVVDSKQAVANAIRITKSGSEARPGPKEKEGTTSGRQ